MWDSGATDLEMGLTVSAPGSHRTTSWYQLTGSAWASAGSRKITPRIAVIAPAVCRMTAPASLLIEETLRQAANFPTVIVRDDWLMGVIAVQQVQLFLYELFAEANKPMPPTGPKQWSFKLRPWQRQLLEALPAAAPTEQSVKDARKAAFTLFFAEAPAIAKSNGIPWPDELEAAVRAYLIKAGAPLPSAGWQHAQ